MDRDESIATIRAAVDEGISLLGTARRLRLASADRWRPRVGPPWPTPSRNEGDFTAAFREYDSNRRPFVDEVQERIVSFGLAVFAPETEEALIERNRSLAEVQFPVLASASR